MIHPFAYAPPYAPIAVETNPLIPLDNRVQQCEELTSVPSENSAHDRFRPDFGSDPLACAFLETLLQLPASDDPQTYADAVSELMGTFVDPNTGGLAFTTLDQQVEILQHTLEKVGTDAKLTEPLTITLLGTSNLQFQMTKWMQDVVLSGGKTKEFEDW